MFINFATLMLREEWKENIMGSLIFFLYIHYNLRDKWLFELVILIKYMQEFLIFLC